MSPSENGNVNVELEQRIKAKRVLSPECPAASYNSLPQKNMPFFFFSLFYLACKEMEFMNI